MRRLGLVGAFDGDGGLTFKNSKGKSLSPLDLIKFGAQYEDTRKMTQALYHFFDPTTGRPLVINGSNWGETSPDWILDGGTSDQPFSYKKAKYWLNEALTNTGSSDARKAAWGIVSQRVVLRPKAGATEAYQINFFRGADGV